jgi:DNA replication protein DnaC
MLIFCGKPGTGKSFGAAVAVREYLKSRVPNVLDRKTWANAKKAATAVVWCGAMELTDGTNTALRAKKEFLAVIDDLGREDSSGNTLAAIRGVISKRYDSKLPTVITTELTMTDISARYGRYILEKIIEDIEHGGKIIDCGDVSTRMMDGGKKKA